MKNSSFSVFLIVGLIQGCYRDCMKANEFKKIIAEKINIGDARGKTEKIMSQEGIEFSFDKHSNRYQATILGHGSCSSNHAISLYVYIDNAGSVSNIEAIDSYTMP